MIRRAAGLAVAAILTLGACSSSSTADNGTATTKPHTTTTTAEVEPLTILVTNDDGIGAPGIDALVNSLQTLDAVTVVVVAPATNQSGTSDKTTPGGATHADGVSAGGIAGTAVNGFPADAVNVALDDLGIQPDLVVSGINKGQNIGPLAFASGTVGAARTAARRGIPAVAGSAGLDVVPNFVAAVQLVVAWIEDHRAALAAGTVPTDTVTSFNVPTCTAGTMKPDLLEVPLAATIPAGTDPFHSDCTITPAAKPSDDVAALAAGYAAESLVPLKAP